MPITETRHPYPLIDADPHFSRVVRYMRTSDYATWGAAAAAGPTLLYLFERVDPSRYRHGIGPAARLTAFIGVMGGFMLAYQNSSKRFWGWSENGAEVQRDQRELSALAAAGKPVYGESDMPEHILGAAARNSTWSQLKLQAMPWFNFVNHNSHGVDTAKYGVKADHADASQRPS